MQNKLNFLVEGLKRSSTPSRPVWSLVALPNKDLPSIAYKESMQQRWRFLYSILKFLVYGSIPLHIPLVAFMWREVFITNRFPVPTFINYSIYLFVLFVPIVYLLRRMNLTLVLALYIVITSLECIAQTFVTRDIQHFSFAIPTVGVLAVILSVPTTVFIVMSYSLFLIAVTPILLLTAIIEVPIISITTVVFFGIFAGIGSTVGKRLDDLAMTMYTRQLEAVEHEKERSEAEHAIELDRERERAHLRSKLHDDLQQDLVAVTLKQQAAINLLFTEQPARQELARAQEVLRGSLSMVRQLIRETRTLSANEQTCESVLDGEMLSTLPFCDFARKVAEYWPIHIELLTEGEPRSLPHNVDQTLKYVVKEACFNIVKHAGATHVDVILNYRDVEHIRLIVQDDGQGAEGISDGEGLRTIRQRVDNVGGTVAIDTAEDEGFALIVEVPA